MLVRRLPPAFDLAEAGGPAKPALGGASVRQCSTHPVEAVAEGEPVAYLDGEVVDLIDDRPLQGSERRLPMLPERVGTDAPQGRCEVEREDRWSEKRHDAVDIFRAERRGEALDPFADASFGDGL